MTKPKIYDIIALHRVGGDCMEDASVNKRIINEIIPQIKKVNELKGEYRNNNEKFGSKMLGNIIANTIRDYIQNIINYYNLDYSVSLNNAFIDGCPIEWDLIIFDKALLPKNNIIDPTKVKAVIEFKTSGTIDVLYNKRSKEEFLEQTFGKAFETVKKMEQEVHHKINFGYITFSTDIDWFKATKEYFNKHNEIEDTAFAFLDDKELEKGNIVAVEGCAEFEKYLFNLLGDR